MDPHAAGRYSPSCRATDADGNVQPGIQQEDRESYMANWSVPVEVNVVEVPGEQMVLTFSH